MDVAYREYAHWPGDVRDRTSVVVIHQMNQIAVQSMWPYCVPARGFAILPRSATAFYQRPDVCVIPIEDTPAGRATLGCCRRRSGPRRLRGRCGGLRCSDGLIGRTIQRCGALRAGCA